MKPRLSLAVIYRSPDPQLDRLIESLKLPDGRWHVDELVLVDTGSASGAAPVACDGLPVVQAEYRCPKEFMLSGGEPCIGDFAAARNYSFGLATGEWRMFLDSDDELVWKPGFESRLSDWIGKLTERREHKHWNSIAFRYLYSDELEHDRPCIFRWGADGWTWRGAVHEYPEPALSHGGTRLLAATTDASPFEIHHLREDGASSLERNRTIIERELATETDQELRIRYLQALASQLLEADDAAGLGPAYQLMEHRPESGEAYVASLMAGAYLRRHFRLDEAVTTLTRATFYHSSEQAAYVELGRVLRDKNDLGRAATAFAHAYLEGLGSGFQLRKTGLDTEVIGRCDAARVFVDVDMRGEARAVLAGVPKAHAEAPLVREARHVVEREIADKVAAEAVRTLTHYLLGQDEADRAEVLTSKVVPLTLRNQPAVRTAVAATARRVEHLYNPVLYKAGYSECTTYDGGAPWGRPYLREIIERVVGSGAQRIVDVGCNTGWFLCHLAVLLPGAELVGIEVDTPRLEAARARAEAMGVADRCRFAAVPVDCGTTMRDIEHALGQDLYHWADAVVSSEVIEHVADVQSYLTLIGHMVRPSGRVYVTTPDVERYDRLVDRARRLDVPMSASVGTLAETFGHVRAYDAHRLADEVGAHFVVLGVEPIDAFDATEEAEVDGEKVRKWTGRSSGDQILLLATGMKAAESVRAPSRRTRGRLDIYAPGFVDWGPRCHELGFAGGSEQAVAHLAPALAWEGWDVHVWASPMDREWFHRGVYWHHADSFMPAEPRDALIVWRRSDTLAGCRAGARGRWPVLYWAHDVAVYGRDAQYAQADGVFCLSPYHRSLFEAAGARRIWDLQNGVDARVIRDVLRAVQGEERNPHAVIYGSSADRGLLALLRMWPAVREAVPDAELHVCYSWDLLRSPATLAHLVGLADLCEGLCAELAGVVSHGGLPHRGFLEVAARCGVWAYPCVFPEISCIVAMEMQALGVWPVVTTGSALDTTVFVGSRVDRQVLEDQLGLDDEQRRYRHLWKLPEGAVSPAFLGALVEALHAPPAEERRAKFAAEALDRYDWTRTAAHFDAAIREAIRGHADPGDHP